MCVRAGFALYSLVFETVAKDELTKLPFTAFVKHDRYIIYLPPQRCYNTSMEHTELIMHEACMHRPHACLYAALGDILLKKY